MSTVFITGGSRGIGAAIARTFAFKGWNIAFSYLHSEEAAHALQNELSARGISVLAVRADAADPAQAAAFIERAVQELGAPDALVCSAGVALPQNVLTHVSDEDWRRVFSVNVDGLFYTVRAALPYFIRRRKGAIVTMSSMWGQIGGLFRQQGRGHRLYQGAGQGGRPLQHPGQLRRPRRHRHRHERPSLRGGYAGAGRGDPAGAHRHSL